MADIDADVIRLSIANEANAVVSSKKGQFVHCQDTERVVLHDHTLASLSWGVSDDSKQMLLAGAQIVSGAKTFENSVTIDGTQELLIGTMGKIYSDEINGIHIYTDGKIINLNEDMIILDSDTGDISLNAPSNIDMISEGNISLECQGGGGESLTIRSDTAPINFEIASGNTINFNTVADDDVVFSNRVNAEQGISMAIAGSETIIDGNGILNDTGTFSIIPANHLFLGSTYNNVAVVSTTFQVASATSDYASLNIPAHDAPPSSPNEGDMWADSGDLYFHIDGVTRTIDMTPS